MGCQIEGLHLQDLPGLYKLFKSDPAFRDWEKLLGFPFDLAVLKEKTFNDIDFKKSLFLGGFVDKEIIGCVFGVCRKWKKGYENDGWIKFIVVRDDFRRKGVGTELLTSLEKQFIKMGVKRLIFGSSSPNYLVPGLPVSFSNALSYFMKNGWQKKGIRLNLEINVKDVIVASKNNGGWMNAQTNHEIQPVKTHEDWLELEKFLTCQFSRSWYLELKPASFNYNDAFVIVARLKSSGRIIGFSAVNCTNKNWLGPIGVSQDYRQQGIGKRLLMESVRKAHNLGIKRLIIPWVSKENQKFYNNCLNSKVSSRYWKLEKTLEI
ncbi:MAG: GNAT family N-acetyltransferase [Promethearchaeota archaeon]